jgi:hypothetical protein
VPNGNQTAFRSPSVGEHEPVLDLDAGNTEQQPLEVHGRKLRPIDKEIQLDRDRRPLHPGIIGARPGNVPCCRRIRGGTSGHVKSGWGGSDGREEVRRDGDPAAPAALFDHPSYPPAGVRLVEVAASQRCVIELADARMPVASSTTTASA